ncbi:MAG: hypothetical protein ACOX45_01975 [Acutalibacteraceae bacterium]
MFFRKVARETLDNGWVYTFVYEDFKDKKNTDSGLIKYSFFGINLRYKYDDNYINKVVHIPENPEKGKTYTDIITPLFLMLGEGSQAEKNDMQLIEKILDSQKSAEELLALNPDDYTFESVDKEMFFRLMKTALTGEPQKEGEDKSYWEKPCYAFFSEPTYLSGYKFQIAFLQETGCVDELYIDVLYQNGNGYKDYVQLSDLVENNTATEEQKQAFERIVKITEEIKENENYITNADEYKNEMIGGVDFSRLYNFLNNIHTNKFELYHENPRIETIEGTEKS